MSVNAYKSVEKKWKRVKITAADDLTDRHGVRIPEAAELLDATSLTPDQARWVVKVGDVEICPGTPCPIYALRDPTGASCGDSYVHAGFFILPGALDASTQRLLAEKCLNEYAEAPHTTNLHPLGQQIEGIWAKSTACAAGQPDPMDKLHWAALGYHYDWTNRAYPREKGSHIPKLLQTLGVACAEAVGLDITSEAALVNYYKAGSTMGGHQDNVEVTFDHPVVSFSVGSSAIFLKGGLTKDEPPIEILLRSGDAIVMGGASRLCFHGIAKTLPTRAIPAFPERLPDANAQYAPIARYVRSNRLNINVRQVFASDENKSVQQGQKGQ
ncbi:alkylated DNA repair protein alkB-like protein [Achlya hypogyna]|uniref:Alkylated DNA repair protein alkB-like protein n=1 Tax=Achlya hypogyna TaxID=1202772 RepID=A0A1V9YH16_ACHHY|nr:alkylated DNA repair protein alkB-like protein [Achlya hypogyna]